MNSAFITLFFCIKDMDVRSVWMKENNKRISWNDILDDEDKTSQKIEKECRCYERIILFRKININ